MQNPYRQRADEHKNYLKRQFRLQLSGGVDEIIPVVAALAELLAEVATATTGPETAIELFKHMINEIERNPDNPHAVPGAVMG